MTVVALKVVELQLVSDQLVVGHFSNRGLHSTYELSDKEGSIFPQACFIGDKW